MVPCSHASFDVSNQMFAYCVQKCRIINGDHLNMHSILWVSGWFAGQMAMTIGSQSVIQS